ncbi:MAG TPA: hypothetical protein VFD07_01075, partial [Candidatus Krumholzibacteria bacterium]|nr:hypothetical protein [Candidatus Krumholzibacteria bacterium]
MTACAFLTGSAAVPLTLRGDCIEYDGYLRLHGGLNLPAANEVKIAGSYAYVIADKTLHVVDITNPVAPQDVGQVVLAPTSPWINAMAVQSPYVFVTAPDRFGSLWIVDVSNPHAPRIVGAFFAGFPVGEVVTSGAYVYVTTLTGIGIVDASNLSAPTLVNTVNIPRGAGALAVAGNHVYVVGQLGLTIVDVSTPLNASIIGEVDLPGAINGSITLAGEYAYVGDSLSPSGTGDDLQIVDISDPSAPTVVHVIPQKSVEAVVVGNQLYRISPVGLLAFDVTDPTSPTITGSLPAAGGYGL